MNYEEADFETLWKLLYQNDKEALGQLLIRFDSLIKSKSRINGRFDEDLAQDIRETFTRALKKRFINE